MMKSLLKAASLVCLLFTVGSLSAQTTMLTEDFESGMLPSGWTLSQNSPSVGFEFGDASTISSTYWTVPAHTNFAASNDDANDDNSGTLNLADMDRIITPAQDLTSASAVFMRFAGFYTGQWGSTASVEVSTDGGSSWTEVMAVDPSEAWQDVVVSLNDYVGMNNVMVAFRHNDNGVWADGFAVDDVEIFEPVAYDVAVNTIDLPAYAAAGNITISGMLTNNGGMTITELQMSYAVDGGSPVTQTVSGLSIAPGATYNYAHPDVWAATVGNHTVAFSVLQINGNADMNPGDEDISADVAIAADVEPHIMLGEIFTSSNCPPCGTIMPPFHALIESNAQKAHYIAYHVWWPATTDPFYNFYMAAADTRVAHYSVSAAPDCVVNGTWQDNPAVIDQSLIDEMTESPTIVKIEGDASVTGSDLTVNVDITSHVDLSNLTAHIVVTEKEIIGNTDPNPNTETEFHNVVRNMMPSPNGTAIASMTASQTTTLSETTTLDLSVIQADELEVVVFVQVNGTNEVLQTGIIDVMVSGIGDNIVVDELNLFPTPVQNDMFIDFTIGERNDLVFEVFNTNGQVVSTLANQAFAAGSHRLQFDASELSAGVYFVSIASNEGRQMQKFTVIR